jgi:hypothetical protein
MLECFSLKGFGLNSSVTIFTTTTIHRIHH